MGHDLTSTQPIYSPQLSGRRSEQRATLLSHPPPAVHWGAMEEREPVLMGEGKEAAALGNVSSRPHVVAGPRAVMNRGEMKRQGLG